MRPDGPRDPVVGLESGPESPFPVRLSGPVIKGFGRGSREVSTLFVIVNLSFLHLEVQALSSSLEDANRILASASSQ